MGECLFEVEDAEILTRIPDIDQVIGNFAVFGEVLPGAEVHSAVDLAGVGGNDFSAEGAGDPDSDLGFTRCCGAEDDDKVE
jgi:hypothetical protein